MFFGDLFLTYWSNNYISLFFLSSLASPIMHPLFFLGIIHSSKEGNSSQLTLKWPWCSLPPASPTVWNSPNPSLIFKDTISILKRNLWKSALGTLMTGEQKRTHQEHQTGNEDNAQLWKEDSSAAPQQRPGQPLYWRREHKWHSRLKLHKDMWTPSLPGEAWEPIKIISLHF